MLCWSQRYTEVVWLDTNAHQQLYTSYDGLLAMDAASTLISNAKNSFVDLKKYHARVQDWIFGYLSYDAKNATEALVSQNFDGLAFPDLIFFQPKRIIELKENTVTFRYLMSIKHEVEEDFEAINTFSTNENGSENTNSRTRIRLRVYKDQYLQKIEKILTHIHRGDIYEANFCQEFYAEDVQIDPLRTFCQLNTLSRAPFSVFFKYRDHYALSASPERYLKRTGVQVISQPIKGTAKRAKNSKLDKQLKKSLEINTKERAENVMIVDLVRNDLSKSAEKGSVEVVELCKVYSFEQVHQMISTIIAQVAVDKNSVEILEETFPMGSMTGAPKIAAMKIIERLEVTKRGLYSGTIGYFTPQGDFDFNVVIRSILYNAKKRYVSFSVGSAITAKAIPEREYEECLLKAKAMRTVLERS